MRVVKACKGAIAVIVVLSGVVMISLAGVGVDIGRQNMQQARMKDAADAAALAGTNAYYRALQQGNVNGALALGKQEAMRLFQANYGQDVTPRTGLEAGGGIFVEAEQTLPTTLMRVLGENEMAIAAYTCSGFNAGRSRLAACTGGGRPQECTPNFVTTGACNATCPAGLVPTAGGTPYETIATLTIRDTNNCGVPDTTQQTSCSVTCAPPPPLPQLAVQPMR